MAPWPFGQRGGLTVVPFSSEDPLVCAHQAVRLKILLSMFEGRYEETCMVLNRLEIVYLSAGRFEDADRAHAAKISMPRPASAEIRDYGPGIIGRFGQWFQVLNIESRYRHGQMVIDTQLADLDRRAPWKSGRDADAVWGRA